MSYPQSAAKTTEIRASRLDVARPRPQLVRASHHSIDGEWGFATDDDNVGLAERWFDGRSFERSITVPYPPESVASGIGEKGFHPVVWYRRTLTQHDLDAAEHGDGLRLLVHFGAVDYNATVWVNGHLVGSHTGGHTPFTVDVTDALQANSAEHVIVVRAEDDPHDLSQPRGKQDWELAPHTIWYHRTTGIWQPVWLEAAPAARIVDLHWRSDLAHALALVDVTLTRAISGVVTVSIAHDGTVLGEVSAAVTGSHAALTIPLAGQDNGQAYERLLWRPGSPTLLDAWVTVTDEHGAADVVASYLGLREVAVADGAFLLNARPLVLRSVLSQGYWPQSHLAAPSADALRREAEVILEMGFNAVRVHQKVEDERFMYWADRLGLLVWGEMAATYAYSDASVQRTIAEWSEAVVRDRSHPCIVTWVPLNESWGVQHIAERADQRAFSEALYALTHALDGTRPVISNDGWELSASDLWTIHDYEADGDVLTRRYDVPESVLRERLEGIGPAGRVIRLPGTIDSGQPVMVTEFGGVKWSATEAEADAWGYSEAANAEDFEQRIRVILEAIQSSSRGYRGRPDGLAGWCWTQLTDTLQEQNGLLTDAREPKIPMDRLRALITGTKPAEA